MQPGERPLRAFLAPIEYELNNPATREIVVNRPGEVLIETGTGWTVREVPEFTFDRLDQIAILAAYQTGRDVDADHPFVGSTLPDGQRIHICRPPATLPGSIAMAIRRPPNRARTMDDDDFSDLFSDTNTRVSRSTEYDEQLHHLRNKKDFYSFFKLARVARKTIDVCGVTGSGKTDFARRLIQETSSDARMLTIESDHEYGPIGPHNRVNLFYNEQHPKMQPTDVVRTALRMRPDEIWFQECKGEEAWAVMRARGSGHRGGGTTWHADEGKEIEALMLMIRQYPPASALTDERLRAICLQYVEIIVWCDRAPDQGFKVPRVWMKGTGE